MKIENKDWAWLHTVLAVVFVGMTLATESLVIAGLVGWHIGMIYHFMWQHMTEK